MSCQRVNRRRRLLAMGAASVWPVAAFAISAKPITLRVAAYPLIDDIVREALPGWRERHPGVAVEVVTRQYADHHTAMTTALSTAVGLPDVMALEASYVGRFAHGLGLDDLARPAFGALELRPRFVAYAFDQAINARGEVVALPTDIGPGTLLYRQDLLDRSGVSEADLTRSWESYVAAGRRIKDATGAYLLPSTHALKDILIRIGLEPGQGLYFDRDSRVLVNSRRFARAFELALQVRRQGLDARVNAWSNEWAEGFKRGTVATELSGAWMVGQLANWVAPQTRGLWRCAQLPEQTFVSYGGTYYAIPRRSRNDIKALAWSLIRWLTLDPVRQGAAFEKQDAFPALLETHDAAFFREPVSFLGGQPARLLWRDAARRISALQVHKQSNFADEVVSTELDNVLERQKPIASALADAERVLQKRAHR